MVLQNRHYMIEENFEEEYFDILAEPELADIIKTNSSRKPSYDDIIPCLFDEPLCTTFFRLHSESVNRAKKSESNEQSSIKKERKLKEKVKNVKEGTFKGHWRLQENKRYHWFLEIHAHHFLNKHLRRMDKIFTIMERFVKTRQAEQCRSHHQKMQKKHGTFQRIIEQLRMQHYCNNDIDVVFQDMRLNSIDSAYESTVTAPNSPVSSEQKHQKEPIESTDGEMEYANENKENIETFIDPLKQLDEEQQIFLQKLVF